MGRIVNIQDMVDRTSAVGDNLPSEVSFGGLIEQSLEFRGLIVDLCWSNCWAQISREEEEVL